MFTHLICRIRFNRRCKRLQDHIKSVQHKLTDRLQDLSHFMVVDSVPVPVDIMAREQRYKAFRKSFETAPVKGNSAVNRCWFICYKLHVVIFDNGMIQQRAITKGNVHDINYLKSIDHSNSATESATLNHYGG